MTPRKYAGKAAKKPAAKAVVNKGLQTEELIRAYFLRSNFFVVRGVKFQTGGDDLTDIDLWVYERSSILARRRLIIDIKDRKLPAAAERLFFVKGLAEVLQVEAVGIVTSDSRVALRDFAQKHNVLWIDGKDVQRLKSAADILFPSRISEEELTKDISLVDSGRRSKAFKECFERIKSSVATKFGPACANLTLEEAQYCGHEAIAAHPDTPAAKLAGRLTYLSAAFAAAAFDFASIDTALRPMADRAQHFTDTIRYGDDAAGTLSKLRWTEQAIREFTPDGAGTAQIVRERFNEALMSVPAEGLAEIVARLTRTDAMYTIAKQLEMAAYAKDLPVFDELTVEARTFLGATLDFLRIDRAAFAKAWKSSGTIIPRLVAPIQPPKPPGTLL